MSRRPQDRSDAPHAPEAYADTSRARAVRTGGERVPVDGAGPAGGGRPRDARREARDAAIAYLARAAHTKEEVIRHLSMRRQAPDDIAREVADALEQEGLLNDRRLAERAVEVAVGGRKAESRARLVQRLRQRGIAGDIVREAVLAQPVDELSAARRLARAKWLAQKERLARRASALGDEEAVLREEVPKALRAVGAYLGRKGFPGEVIRQVLAELGTDEE